MPKAQTGASLFESGDGVWLHLMGEPTKSPLFREAMAQVRPEGQRDDPNVLFGMFDGWPEALMLRPSGEWLESFWANDVPVQPALAPGRDLHQRAGARQRLRDRGRPPRARTHRDGRIADHGRPADADAQLRARPRRAHRGGARRVEAARTRTGTSAAANADDLRWPLEGVKVVDAGAFLAGPLGPMLLADLGADVVKVEPPGGEGMRWVEWSFFGCQRGKRGVALDLKARDGAARARRVDRRCRHLPPQPADAGRAAPRPSTRRRCGRSTPTSSTATPARTAHGGRAPTGRATTSCSRRRAAGRSRARARATRRCGTASASWTTCARWVR